VDPIGAAALMIACLAWAVGSLLARDARMPRPTLLGAAMQMLCGGGALLVLGLVTGEAGRVHLTAVSTTSLVAVAYLVAFGSLVGYTAYIWLVANVAPTHASTYAYVNPIVAVFLGWAIADEPVGPRVIVSAAVIIGAVALVTLGQQKRIAAAPETERRREVA
jgi:drug/metabolite transporter (DMT)-like permease